MMSRMTRASLTVLGAVALGTAGFGAYAWKPAIAPIERPSPASFSKDQLQRGELLAAAGYCGSCHTVKGGKSFAGGYAMATQFGTIYSTNISPDVKTGIGAWSKEAFRRAMREGVARDGSHLLPAFPYEHFSKLTDQDIDDIYAFLMVQPAVEASPRENTVPFPLNIRALQAGWKLLFFHPKPFTADPARSAAWNRGAYLAEGLSHCGACHTPRNMLGGERHDRAFGGAAIDGWIAPPLDGSDPAPVAWSQDELAAYLGTGVSQYHGTAAGPMAPVVHGLARLPASDVQAIATYFADLDGSAGKSVDPAPALTRAAAANRMGTGLTYDRAARLYAAACASCHYNGADSKGGARVNPLRPELALNNALNLDDPTNLIQVMLHGIDARDGAPGVVMPAFGHLKDGDIAQIAAWLRATRTGKAPWPDLDKTVAAVRAQAGKGE
jgi:mono/diheme cytochrome c family protein